MNKEVQYWNKVCRRSNLSVYTKAECNKRSKPRVVSNMNKVNAYRYNPFQKPVLKTLAEKRAGQQNTSKNIGYEPNGRGGWKKVSTTVSGPPRLPNMRKNQFQAWKNAAAQKKLARESAQTWKKTSGLNKSAMKCKCKRNSNKEHYCKCIIPNKPRIHSRWVATNIF
jgi:hypothetical protein